MENKLNPFAAPPKAFISYARSDGAKLASSLREKLTREHSEITLWFDRARMEGGIGWWKQITEALDKVDILIMVFTPGAVRSKIAAKEWRYAKQQGIRICPVMTQEFIFDSDHLPNWMRKAHFYNIDLEWDTFIGFLLSPAKKHHVPFMAPDLTEYYIQRSQHYEKLLSLFIDKSGENPRFGISALQGAGGFGKTTLASALCHHENIISAFDDGILWASLGENPNIRSELTKMYAAVTGDRLPFIDTEDASIQLAVRLEQKNCLIIIDDVWDPNHLKPFMRGAKGCARLITTRQLRVTTESGATRIPVENMTTGQAIKMLTSRVESSAADVTQVRQLAETLGKWPLLLKLAGSQLKERIERGDSLEGALNFIHRAIARKGVVAFDPASPVTRNDAIANTVEASLDLFSVKDRERCAQLAIFRNDIPAPFDAACTLLDLDEFDTEELLLRLDGAAIMEFDLKTGEISIHNVLRSYLASQLENPKTFHSRLVEEWLKTPYDLPTPYAWTWIGWHLVQSGESERLKKLLLDFRWIKSRLSQIQVQELLEDFERIDICPETKIIRDALRLSSYGLSVDTEQLQIQLCGRILGGQSKSINEFLKQAEVSASVPGLALTGTSLTHPGGTLTGILKSHTGPIETLATSRDGNLVVSGSMDCSLRLWDMRSNRVIKIFEGHTGMVNTVAFMPDETAILSGSEDRMIYLWDIQTTRIKATLKGHTLGVQGLSVSGDGKTAASVSEDGTVRIWNIEKQKSRQIFKGRGHQLNAVAMTSDGTNVMFGAGDWSIGQLDVTTGELAILRGHSSMVRSLTVTRDGLMLLSGDADGNLRVWRLENGGIMFHLTGHSGSIDTVAVTDDGKFAVTGSRDKTLCVWNLESGNCIQTLRGHSGFVKACAFSPSAQYVISGATDRTIRYWNITSTDPHENTGGHTEAVFLLSMSADASRAVSCDRAGSVVLWDTGVAQGTDGKIIGSCPDVEPDKIVSLKMTPDGKFAIIGFQNGQIRVWNLAQGTVRNLLGGHKRKIIYLDISADGKKIVSISADHTMRLWDMESGKTSRVLVSRDDERRLALLGVGNPMLEELDDRPQVDLIRASIERGLRIAISPDGGFVSIGCHGSIWLWDLDQGSVREINTDDFPITALSFGNSSETIVLGSLFGELVLWEGKQEPVILEGHRGEVMALSIRQDSRQIISSGREGTIRVWDMDSHQLKRIITGVAESVDISVIPSGGDFAYSIYSDTLVVYSLKKSKVISTLSLDHRITAICTSPDGKHVVLGDQSGQMHFACIQM